MMTIICTGKDVANHVKGVLFRQGIGVSRYDENGPHIGDPTISLVLNIAINSSKEAAIRHDIGRISGATIEEA
jgi:hypothetical protein